jgi:hypothetical protein
MGSGVIDVLFPFFDGCVCDANSKQFGQLGHGKSHINALLPQMLAQCLWVGRILPKLLEMKGIWRSYGVNCTLINSQQGQL